jgi:hypothetical protein
MKKLLLLITIAITLSMSVSAKKLDEIFRDYDFSEEIFPETRFQEIKINNIDSPLEYDPQDRKLASQLESVINPGYEEGFRSLLSQSGLFNTFSMGTGAVDVTFQVKNGVNYALKENFSGYLEFQRRKISEEIINANFNNHKVINNLLINSALSQDSGSGDFFDYIWNKFTPKKSIGFFGVITSLMSLDENNKIFKIIQIFCLGLLSLVIISQVFLGFFEHGLVLGELVSKSVLRMIKFWLLILLIPFFMEILVLITNILQNCFVFITSQIDYQPSDYLTKLKQNWTALANNTGYIPALVLSVADLIGQIYCLIFIGGIILRLTLGKIFSPLWALALAIDGLNSRAMSSVTEWVKALLFLASLPVFFLVFNQIFMELEIIDIPFIYISLDLAKFYLLPRFSELILGDSQSNNINVFYGYKQISSEINDYIHEMKNIIYNQQLDTRS